MRMLALPLTGLFLVVAAAGCSSTRGYCEASSDCDSEVFGFEVDDAGDAEDSVGVCTANQDARLSALRANEEDECHEVANALDAYFACVANEFAGGEDGCDAVNDECDDELEDFQDAQADINGDECSASEE